MGGGEDGIGEGSGGAAVGMERVVEREALEGSEEAGGGRGGRGWGVEVLAVLGKGPRRAGREVKLLMCKVKTAYMPSTVYQAVASDWADVS